MPEAGNEIFIASADPLQAREAALLRIFAITGRLTNSEAREIAHIFPPGLVRYTRLPAAIAYRKPYLEYARIYDAGLSTIKYWISRGKKRPEGILLPPLDDPSAMPDWWHRTLSQSVPANILDAAKKCRPDNLQEARFFSEQAGAVAGEKGGSHAVVIEPATGPLTEGFALHLRNIRAELAKAHADLQAARRGDDDVKISQANSRYLKVSERAEAAEAKAPDILRKMGLLLDREELAATLSPMLQSVAEGTLALYRRVKKDLLAAADDAEADDVWHRGVYALFEELFRSGYVAPFTLSA